MIQLRDAQGCAQVLSSFWGLTVPHFFLATEGQGSISSRSRLLSFLYFHGVPTQDATTMSLPRAPFSFSASESSQVRLWRGGGAQRILTGSPGAPWGPGKPLGPGGPSFPRGPGGPRSPCRRAEEEGQAPEKGCFLLVCESGGDSEPWGGMGPLGNLWGHST